MAPIRTTEFGRRTLAFVNAAVVTPTEVLHGAVIVEGGVIVAVQAGATPVGHGEIVDLDGDFLLPGAVDLHTDNLERQVQPRSNARWPSRSALLAHDAQCVAAGITTVLDALCVGDLGFDEDRLRTCAEGIVDLDALGPSGLLRADHFLHLRCELPAMGLAEQLDGLASHPLLRMVSLMDHTPGIGQYGDIARYRAMRRRDGASDDDTLWRIDALRLQREQLRGPNRAALLQRFAGTGVPLASHDDRTEADIAENLSDGISISEFPVTLEAAAAARAGRMRIIGGSPNLVRGGSHTGNIAVDDLLRSGLLDALASDYVPCSLIEAAFAAAVAGTISLPDAVAMISVVPADMARLRDRGSIATGLRGDLVRVRLHDGQPVVRQVWHCGERVH